MAIGIDEIEEIDDFQEYEEQPQEENQQEEKEWMEAPTETPTRDSLIDDILASKGVNPESIKFTDDDGNLQERTWESLTREELFNILNTPEVVNDLSEEESELINTLRNNNLSIDEYANLLRQEGANYVQQQYAQQPSAYTVDDISDDELFLFNLGSKGNMTEEELTRALENAKNDPEIYQKLVDALREEYRNLEKQNLEEQNALEQQYQQDQFNQFAETIYDNIENFGGIGGLDINLDNDDKETLSEFILGRGADGVSNLGRAINDPETLTKMAWFALFGPETLDGMVDYFKGEIAKVREESYRRGFEEAKKGNPQVVVQQRTRPAQNYFAYLDRKDNIDDLD